MHRLAIASLVLLLAACAAVARPLDATITKMGNGLTVILQEDHSAELVAIDVWVKAGSGYETAKNNGVSHFIEHLLFGATQKRKPGDMDREMESLGATLDAHTNLDYAHFSTTVSSRYVPKALDVFADAVINSQFRSEDIEAERQVLLDEIADKETKPRSICRDMLAKGIYGDHPYGLPIEGSRQNVKRFTRDDILEYYRRYYVPSNIAIVVVGDIDKQTAVSEVGKAFQGLSGPPVKDANRPAIAKLTKQMTLSAKFPSDNTYLGIGYLGPASAKSEDVCAMDVLLTYLGVGYRSWLSDALAATQHLIGDGVADFTTQRDPALISIIVSATSANVTKAKDAIFGKIEQIRTQGITQAELDRAKRSLLGQAAFQSETVGGRANDLGFYFAAADPVFAGKYTDSINAVSLDAIKRVAAEYLDPNTAVVVTLGPDQEASK